MVFTRGAALEQHATVIVEQEHGNRAMQDAKLVCLQLFLRPDLSIARVDEHDPLGGWCRR